MRNAFKSGLDRAPQHTCSQSAVEDLDTHDGEGVRVSKGEI